MKKVLTASLVLLLAAASLPAQNKAETKLYQKTLSKPSVEAFDKFLKKYPSSVYASDILARKDTLLNISPYDMEQASAIARPLLPEDAVFRAIADRREAIRTALLLAPKGATVLLAGKGHETYQILGTVKNHFDEREIVLETFKTLEQC